MPNTISVCSMDTVRRPAQVSEAYFWLDLAAAGASGTDREKYVKSRDTVAAKLSPDELSKVQERAAKWFASIPQSNRSKKQLPRLTAGGPGFLGLFSFPVPELWVPRPCGLCKGGYDAAGTMGFSCPAACIAVTVLIICTLSPPVVTSAALCSAAAAIALSSFARRTAEGGCLYMDIRRTETFRFVRRLCPGDF